MIRQYVVALQREICSPACCVLFEAARRRHHTLEPYESPDDVLAALSAESRASNGDKDAITRALVAEYQTSRGPLWHAILVLAYMPMLANLSNRIRLDIRDPVERDHVVLSAFWETLRSISCDCGLICLTLRRRTARRVFKHLGRERQDRRRERAAGAGAIERGAARAATWLPDGASLWPATRGDEDADDGEDLDARAALLAQIARGVLDEEELELVNVTLVEGLRLTAYVARRHLNLDEPERRRLYQRCKRRHSRALAKLRAHLQRDQRRAGEGEDVEPDIADVAAAEQGVDADVIEHVTFVGDDMPLDSMALVA